MENDAAWIIAAGKENGTAGIVAAGKENGTAGTAAAGKEMIPLEQLRPTGE